MGRLFVRIRSESKFRPECLTSRVSWASPAAQCRGLEPRSSGSRQSLQLHLTRRNGESKPPNTNSVIYVQTKDCVSVKTHNTSGIV